ncbi:TldD/PmbA family protein [Candidatus Atribacteria bacterium 1244-E10-H5-B2]|nr:MAG: TldD/PmbA family protein [Candidatus Atribacteria bacterium 1244-E10-H5-B2]
MIDINSGKELVNKVKSFLKNYDFEIIASEDKSELTRFAESYIHQNVAETDLNLTVKVINEDRIGAVQMNSIDDRTISKNIEKAIEVTKITPKLDYHYQLLKPQSYKIKSKYSKDTASFTPLNRAQLVRQLIKEVNKRGYKAAGAFKTEEATLLVANSERVFAFDRGTKVDFNCVITRDNSTAHTSFIDSDINNFNINKITDELLETAFKNVEQIEIEPGVYTVILSPEAVAEILNYTGYTAFNGKMIMEGKSFVCHNKGKKIFPETITVSDDPFDELTMPIPFDLVGYPREKTALIKGGVIKDGVYDHLTALKYNRKCTGNTLPPEYASFGALPFNPVMKEGSNSVEEMISSTKKGIYVSRFHYVNILNPMSIQLTGMTRDGTFLIEDGKLGRAIKNMRFNTSVVDMLKAVDMISKERQIKSGFIGPAVAPYLRTNSFTFSSKTSF